MRNIVLLLIFFVSLPLSARDVYKWTNPDGVVIYSDVYQEGAERVRVTGGKSSSPPPANSEGQTQTQGDEASGGYASLEIVQPENDATIRSNEGTVSVSLALTPTLGEGHWVKILVDGTALEGEVRSSQFSLNNLNRGTHSLQTQVLDAEGNVLISSNPINFHLRQASILTP